MKVYQLTIRVLGLNGMTESDIESKIENIDFAHVSKIESREIGEWSDDHPLNKFSTAEAEWERLFNKELDDEHFSMMNGPRIRQSLGSE